MDKAFPLRGNLVDLAVEVVNGASRLGGIVCRGIRRLSVFAPLFRVELAPAPVPSSRPARSREIFDPGSPKAA
jgi:hypothetical protein